MSIYEEKRNEIKESLIDTAVSLFREKGYDNVSISNITDEVGIAKGTFYNYFSYKRDILFLWSRRKFKKINLEGIIDGENTIEENLKLLIGIIVNKLKGEEELISSFLRELMKEYNENPSGKRVNIKKMFYLVITGSKDYPLIGDSYLDCKVKVLRNALFMEMLHWFYTNKDIEGLEQSLNDIIKITLHGIMKDLD